MKYIFLCRIKTETKTEWQQDFVKKVNIRNNIVTLNLTHMQIDLWTERLKQIQIKSGPRDIISSHCQSSRSGFWPCFWREAKRITFLNYTYNNRYQPGIKIGLHKFRPNSVYVKLIVFLFIKLVVGRWTGRMVS